MASPFASKTVSAPIPLPFDPPHAITVRKLTGRELEEAQEAHRAGVVAGGARQYAVVFRRMLQHGASDPEVIKALADPLTGYDRYVLVRAGLQAWSYPEVVNRVAPAAAADGSTPRDAIDDLDDEAVDFIAREVLRVTKPGLFLTPEEAEAARKNGSGSSIVT